MASVEATGRDEPRNSQCRLPGFACFLETAQDTATVRPPRTPPLVNGFRLSPLFSKPPTPERAAVRTSRYLREIDRRTILERIRNGEKQADLAKEYCVSRAAISNLKHRRWRRDTRHAPFSNETTYAPLMPSATDEPLVLDDLSCLVRVASVAHLVTEFQRCDTPPSTVRRVAYRLARLLLEESLGRIAVSQDDLPSVCYGIATDESSGSEWLLDELQSLEPRARVGVVHALPTHGALANARVILLCVACSETGHELSAGIEALCDRGVRVPNVVIATLVASASGLARVRSAFPALGDVVTTAFVRNGAEIGARVASAL